jgi:hypothetical protein
MSELIKLTGNTYPHKDIIKAAGGRWDDTYKFWTVPSEQHARLQEIITPPGSVVIAKPEVVHPPAGYYLGPIENQIPLYEKPARWSELYSELCSTSTLWTGERAALEPKRDVVQLAAYRQSQGAGWRRIMTFQRLTIDCEYVGRFFQAPGQEPVCENFRVIDYGPNQNYPKCIRHLVQALQDQAVEELNHA